MQNRRDFLKTLGLSGTALGLGYNLSGGMLPTELTQNDAKLTLNTETDWLNFRKNFILKPEKIYLNNGTMGVSPLEVIEATEARMRMSDIEGLYGGEEDEAMQSIAKLINAHKDEIGLTHNVTEGTNIALFGLTFKKGDRIVCTTHEHAGTAFPLLWLAEKYKLKIRAIEIDSNPEKTTQNILNAIDKKTKLICVPHMPCTNGQLLDVKTICSAAKKQNIVTLIDGAHPPGMVRVDVKDIDCDIYVSCGHKWLLGPKGTGFIYVKKDFIPKLKLTFVGAGTHYTWQLGYNKSVLGKEVETARKYYFGSQNAGLYKGLNAAITLMHEKIGMEKVENRVRELSFYLRNTLSENIKDISLYCPETEKHRTGVTAFKIKGQDSQKICNELRSRNIIVRHVHENNLDFVRCSTHIYNNKTDCDTLVENIKQIIT